jgi:hypothetical protein
MSTNPRNYNTVNSIRNTGATTPTRYTAVQGNPTNTLNSTNQITATTVASPTSN